MWKLSPKILFLSVSFIMLTNQSIVNGAILKCSYYTSGFWGLTESVYYCEVQNNGIFTGERVIIDSVDGSNMAGKTNANVQGVYFHSIPSLKFFPQNLENIFSNLIMICFYSTSLQEITQQDLKLFPKLRSLELINNKITTIDADLFKFNPNLEAIVLQNNQISHIDPNVFDHLNNLSSLRLNGNPCKNALSDVRYSRSEVLKLIQRVRDGDCVAATILEKKKQEQEQAVKAPLLAAIEEKTKEISQLQQKLREAEKLSLEQVKTLEESNAELNKNLNDLREENQKLQSENQELKTENKNIQQRELTTTTMTLNEKLRESNDKMIEAKDKYTNLLEAKQTETQSLNDKLHECKDNKEAEVKELNEKYANLQEARHTEIIDCNNKYTNLLNAKLIESEKVIKEQNENIRKNNSAADDEAEDGQMKNIGQKCMIVCYNSKQTPVIMVN